MDVEEDVEDVEDVEEEETGRGKVCSPRWQVSELPDGQLGKAQLLNDVEEEAEGREVDQESEEVDVLEREDDDVEVVVVVLLWIGEEMDVLVCGQRISMAVDVTVGLVPLGEA